MALFGAPLAHEDHARRAVLAALGIQRALKEHRPALGEDLALRMGLNTGPVVVGKIGDNLRMDYTAIGDTTHLAARLQQLAEPDAILVSEATRRLVRGYVRLEALEPVQIKGKTERITAYKVLGVGPRRSPLEPIGERPLSRFVGRERELAALHDLLAQIERGQGQVVGIVGEPGVGKSRFLYEFRQSLEGRRLT
ncbi:MAG: adenylate/guanylate cyclase domain-containing protein, partial [Candidatus Rokubacteria bacterium]|nr:adenylate/guanylate cyclase domain-containing protein [Candidatus Rokubacteria bacterium]